MGEFSELIFGDNEGTKRSRIVTPCVVSRMYKASAKNFNEGSTVCAVLESGEFGEDITELVGMLAEAKEMMAQEDWIEFQSMLRSSVGGLSFHQLIESFRELMRLFEKWGRTHRFLRYIFRRLLLVQVVIKLMSGLAELLPLWDLMIKLVAAYDKYNEKWGCPEGVQCKRN